MVIIYDDHSDHGYLDDDANNYDIGQDDCQEKKIDDDYRDEHFDAGGDDMTSYFNK